VHSEAVLDEVIEQSRALTNLYRYQPQRPVDRETAERRIAQALQAKASPYDSHPSPADRFAWIAALGESGVVAADDDAQPVWDLFADRDAIEQRMTALVRATIATRHGVEIPATAT
jgi:hypothetical protein